MMIMISVQCNYLFNIQYSIIQYSSLKQAAPMLANKQKLRKCRSIGDYNIIYASWSSIKQEGSRAILREFNHYFNWYYYHHHYHHHSRASGFWVGFPSIRITQRHPFRTSSGSATTHPGAAYAPLARYREEELSPFFEAEDTLEVLVPYLRTLMTQALPA